MKTFLLSLCLLIVCTPVSFSQTEQVARQVITIGNRTVIPGTIRGNMVIERVLAKRVQNSFQRAQMLQQRLATQMPLHTYEPSQSTSKFTTVKPHDIYPEVPFLVTQKQLSQYFLAQNNRAIIDMYPKFYEMQQQILLHEKDLQSHKIVPVHPKEQDMAWLAEQIPNNTRYLFIGETHGYKEIQESVSELLPKIRQRFPTRQIFLFSEFLLDGQVLPQENFVAPLSRYTQVWETALDKQITPIGLEPEALGPTQKTIKIVYPTGERFFGMSSVRRKGIRGSLEGVRLRNRHWQKILHNYRQQYPDALFIIYAGAWHVEYNHPYSLSAGINPSETFEVSLYPVVNLDSRDCSKLTSTLDHITQGAFPERVLKFEDPELTHLVGFDVQIKIYVNPRGE